MSINAGVSGSSSQIFVFSVWYMLSGTTITVFLGEAKIYQKYLEREQVEY